jgi:hypothetical protein
MLFNIPPWWNICAGESAYYLHPALDIDRCRIARALACEVRPNCMCFNCLAAAGLIADPFPEEIQAYGMPAPEDEASSNDESEPEDNHFWDHLPQPAGDNQSSDESSGVYSDWQ